MKFHNYTFTEEEYKVLVAALDCAMEAATKRDIDNEVTALSHLIAKVKGGAPRT